MDIADWTRLKAKRAHYRDACNSLRNYPQGMLGGHFRTKTFGSMGLSHILEFVPYSILFPLQYTAEQSVGAAVQLHMFFPHVPTKNIRASM